MMTINYRSDSDGITHQVWAQRQAASCAISSIWMARNQAKQMTIDETEWQLAWRMYHEVVRNMDIEPKPPAPASLDPSAHPRNQDSFENMFASSGTYMTQVIMALKNDGLKVTEATNFSPGQIVKFSKLTDTKPAIVLLGWYQGKKRNGGHFIVASRKTRSNKIVYLDPWGGQLRELGPGPSYLSTGQFEQIIYISS